MASRSHSGSRSASQSRSPSGILTASANEAKSKGYTDTYRRGSKIDQLFAAAHESINSRPTSSHHHHDIDEQIGTAISYSRPTSSHHHHESSGQIGTAYSSYTVENRPQQYATATSSYSVETRPQQYATATSSYSIQTRPVNTIHEMSSLSHHGSTTSLYISPVEKLILDSTQPIESPKPSIVEHVPGTHLSGVLLNQGEAEEWARRTGVDIRRYTINNNFNDAEVITKSAENIELVQELGVRYLKPPLIQPPPIIVQETPRPGPPLIIRTTDEQKETMIFREEPPPKPRMDQVTVEVDVPSTRKVIVEKLPAPPPALIIEKWLPFRFGKREVRRVRARAPPQRNLIITWTTGTIKKIRKCKDLGVVHADPEEYKRLYGSTLLKSHQLPTCDDHEFNHGLVASSTSSSSYHTSTHNHHQHASSSVHQHSFGAHVKDIGSGYHLVTQRADCPCKGDCKCKCHSGGYVINTGNAQSTSSYQVTTRPAAVTTTTTTTAISSSNPLYNQTIGGCVCCCGGQKQTIETSEQQIITTGTGITTTSSGGGCCCNNDTAIPPTECGSGCVCCCHTGTFGGGGYYYPDGRSGLGCCCRGSLNAVLGLSLGSDGHLDNCQQLTSLNGKCPIHQGNQYGSAGYKSGVANESNLPELYGDVNALKAVIDKLGQVGLGDYENYIRRL